MTLVLLPNQQFDPSFIRKAAPNLIVLWRHEKLLTKVCLAKWTFLMASFENYEKELNKLYKVEVFEGNIDKLKHKYSDLTFFDTHDLIINKTLTNFKILQSPYFMLTNEELMKSDNKTFDSFYRKFRKQKNILMNKNTPIGLKWSFDKDNQGTPDSPLPKPIKLKANPIWDKYYNNTDLQKHYSVIQPTDSIIYATSRKEAKKLLTKFINERLSIFGEYQDYYDKDNYQTTHSMLSCYLNVGLITPNEFMDKILKYKDKTTINNIEGCVRQLFWREYMYYIYLKENATNFTPNYWNHTKKISKKLWYGNTNIEPLDHAIRQTCETGYLHHIGRLMFIGSFFLMYGISPVEMYNWFLSMYVDAYDWVMYGNVFSMLYADGGKYMSRPYFSSHNYIVKMSNFKVGDWCDKWDAYYHKFLIEKKKLLLKQYFVSRWVKFADKDLASRAVEI